MSMPFDVASLEPAKRLYELSHWGVYNPQMWQWIQYPKGIYRGKGDNRTYIDDDWSNTKCVPTSYSGRYNLVAPAYNLGYLMRMCAKQDVAITVRYVGIGGSLSMDLKEWYGKYVAFTPFTKQGDYPIADSPEDAACELIARLFEKDILK